MANKRIKVVISDNSINCYGFRILTEGIDLTQYKRNPILLWMHKRAHGDSKEEVLPLGRVEDLEVKDGVLYGVPIIEGTDEFSKQILDKWERGTIKMVSGGFEILEWSEDRQYLMPGQTRATATKSKLVEVSIVDIGGNDNALQLYNNGVEIKLSVGADNPVPLIQLNNEKKMNEELKAIAVALGLAENATAQDCVATIATLMSLKGDLDTLKKEMSDKEEASITLAVDNAVKEKRIKAEQKDHFVSLGKKIGLDSLQITLSAIAPVKDVRPSNIIGNGTTLSKDGYKKLSEVPSSELMQMRENEPDKYKALYKAEYGFECEL